MSLWIALLLAAFQNPDYVDQGRKALDANRNDEAAALFQKAVAADRKDYAAHFHLALADSLLQHDTEAIAEYQKTLELKPGLYQAELNLGILFLRNKRDADAIAPLTEAAKQKPSEFRPSYYLGDALLRTGKAAEAQTYLEAALKANPTAAPAELSLARALLQQGSLTDAEPWFRKAAAQDATYKDALLELGAAEEKAGNAAAAIELYKQFPENAGAQERLGELLIESKQFGDAIPRLEKAVNDSPTAANRLALATAYGMNKEPAKQMEQLAKAVAAEPANYDLRMIFGRALRDAKKPLDAASQFAAAAKIKPDAVDAWNELAGQLILTDRLADGLAALDHVKALGRELPGDVYLRAITLDKLHQKPQAVASYKQFLTMSEGKFPDQEFAARQRIRIIEQELHR